MNVAMRSYGSVIYICCHFGSRRRWLWLIFCFLRHLAPNMNIEKDMCYLSNQWNICMNAWPSLDTSINIFRDGKHSDKQVRVSSTQVLIRLFDLVDHSIGHAWIPEFKYSEKVRLKVNNIKRSDRQVHVSNAHLLIRVFDIVGHLCIAQLKHWETAKQNIKISNTLVSKSAFETRNCLSERLIMITQTWLSLNTSIYIFRDGKTQDEQYQALW